MAQVLNYGLDCIPKTDHRDSQEPCGRWLSFVYRCRSDRPALIVQVLTPPDTLGRRMHRAIEVVVLDGRTHCFPGDRRCTFLPLRMTLFRAWSRDMTPDEVASFFLRQRSHLCLLIPQWKWFTLLYSAVCCFQKPDLLLLVIIKRIHIFSDKSTIKWFRDWYSNLTLPCAICELYHPRTASDEPASGLSYSACYLPGSVVRRYYFGSRGDEGHATVPMVLNASGLNISAFCHHLAVQTFIRAKRRPAPDHHA